MEINKNIQVVPSGREMDYTEKLKECIKVEGNNLTDVINSHFKNIGGNNVRGIYFLYTKERKLLYIGKTINMKTRLKDHINGRADWSKKIKGLIHYIKFYVVEDNGDSYQLFSEERGCISRLKPMFNGAPNTKNEKYYGYKTLRKELDHIENITREFEDRMLLFDGYIDNTTTKYTLNNSGFHVLNKKQRKESNNCKEDKGGGFKIQNSPESLIYSIKESIKLAIKHASDEEADKIIEGFLRISKI